MSMSESKSKSVFYAPPLVNSALRLHSEKSAQRAIYKYCNDAKRKVFQGESSVKRSSWNLDRDGYLNEALAAAFRLATMLKKAPDAKSHWETAKTVTSIVVNETRVGFLLLKEHINSGKGNFGSSGNGEKAQEEGSYAENLATVLEVFPQLRS